MRELTIKCIDAFTSMSFAGNPAGIIDGADGLASGVMQSIAGQMLMNIVEYGFVMKSRSPGAVARVRYFTPTRELECSGHVTIAVCHSLIEDGTVEVADGVSRFMLETGMGDLPVDLHGSIVRGAPQLDRIMMHQPLQLWREAELPDQKLAEVLGIEPSAMTQTGLPLMVGTAGIDWLIVPIDGRERLLSMRPDLIRLGMLGREYGIQTNHLFTLETFSPDCISYARHFGPAMGLWEDPATAVAAGGLGEYLVSHGITSARSMQMEQGSDAGRLARLLVEVDHEDGNVSAVRVGGLAATSLVKRIRVEDDGTLTAV
jgi:trans-2,3-dihydro-3-hydroxyanthranilate isomerase